MPDLFISHSSKDKHLVEMLHDKLVDEGITWWISSENIPTSSTWAGEITTGIRESKVFGLLLTEHSNLSKEVIKEVSIASNHNIPIFTIQVAEFELSRDLEYHLNALQKQVNPSPDPDDLPDFFSRVARDAAGILKGKTHQMKAATLLTDLDEVEKAFKQNKDASIQQQSLNLVKRLLSAVFQRDTEKLNEPEDLQKELAQLRSFSSPHEKKLAAVLYRSMKQMKPNETFLTPQVITEIRRILNVLENRKSPALSSDKPKQPASSQHSSVTTINKLDTVIQGSINAPTVINGNMYNHTKVSKQKE
ncbi:toll/interleukin-1 receptor domain-containing protein [Alteribacter natronophilus]|uniref:toll/interleukin-1 receptor domain-containing protein n=1 Tax=Alteribacter natronophilus TaxID=2583810 RepID=UPI00110D2DEA|nr:toll/interleukin-1 receptor domain-containing protein [Alteribacter natronophilus]TMW72306.1 TIR domain-containing protein [Alteribacter natronophilus]